MGLLESSLMRRFAVVRQAGPATIAIETPAKLNLFLEVLSRRQDGFHEIETLMMAITICDTIYFSSTKEGQIEFQCHWAGGWRANEKARRDAGLDVSLDDVPKGTDNIVVSTIERLRQRASVVRGAAIQLVKRIPSAAGLGGASSDAAAALLAANRAWNLGWSYQQLAHLAAEVGSDVPFFLGNGAAVCRGRGEKITAMRTRGRFHFVVVRPPQGLSTAEVYRNCRPANQPRPINPLLAALEIGSATDVGRCLANRLQPAAENMSPWIGRLQAIFDRLDLLGHQMSGSGSSYFGICRSAHHARRAMGKLRAAGVGQVFQAANYCPCPPQ